MLSTKRILIALGIAGAFFLHCEKRPTSSSGVALVDVCGYVCDATDSTGIQGAFVRVLSSTDSTPTDAGGYFCISATPVDGAVVLKLSSPQHLSQMLSIPIQQSTPVIDSFFINRSYAVVSGVVTDTVGGKTLEGAVVVIKTDGSAETLDSAVTGLSGSFQLTVTLAESTLCSIEISRSAYAQTSRGVQVTIGDSIHVPVALSPYVRIEGRVVESGTLLPVDGATVSASGMLTRTDANGLFALDSLLPRDTGLNVIAVHEYYDTAIFRDTLEWRDSILDDIVLSRKTVAVSGHVDLQGTVVDSGVTVIIGPDTVTSDQAGTFSFPGVFAGRREMTIKKNGFRTIVDTVNVIGAGLAHLSYVLIIESGEIAQRVDWNSDGSPFSITDTIVVKDGGVLAVHQAVEVHLGLGAALVTEGSGVIQTHGEKDALVTFVGDTSLPPVISLRGITGPVLTYTLVENVDLTISGRASVTNSLFTGVNDTHSRPLVTLDVGEEHQSFKQCDFIRIGSSRNAILVYGNASAGSVEFMDCIFYTDNGGAGCSAFIEDPDTTAGVPVTVRFSTFYTTCVSPIVILSATNSDTAFVHTLNPRYVNPAESNYRLIPATGVGTLSSKEGCIGALGLDE